MGQPITGAETKVPSLSALQSLLTSKLTIHNTSDRDHNLALQVAYNLRFQHNWTQLCLHVIGSQENDKKTCLVSGLPPERLYVHPDEQIELLQRQKKAGKSGLPDLLPEREWVLPSHLREKWTLRRFGQIFDAIDLVPSMLIANAIDFGVDHEEPSTTSEDSTNPWRILKRVLLATVDDDSTVVYYIVHDGIQKPRQN